MKFRPILIIFFVSITLTAFFAWREILLSIGDYLIIKDNLQPSDIIHVIAGEGHRADYAITLYKEGYGNKLFFTGGRCSNHNGYHGIRAKQLTKRNGIPSQAVIVDNSTVKSTYDEVIQLKKFIDINNPNSFSVIVVSDPHHMRRARWAYKRVLGDGISVLMAPVPFEISPYDRNWWTTHKSWNFVKNEYIKILYYYARYKYSWGPLKDWLASFDRT